MTTEEKIQEDIKYNCEIAEWVIRQWHEFEYYVDTGYVDVGTTEKLLKFIHKEEIFCRQLVQSLPGIRSIKVCMMIYGEITYGKYKKYHENGSLHMYVAEAIRILLYGISFEREKQVLQRSSLFELLEHIKIMSEAREIAQMIEAGFLCDNENIWLDHGHFCFEEKNSNILKLHNQYFSGKGLRLRMAKDTTKLLLIDLKKRNSLKSEFVESIKKLLSESVCGQDISFFEGTYYEFFPSVSECDHTYKEFLEDLLEKIEFLTTLEILLARQYVSIYPSQNYKVTEMALLFEYPIIIPNKFVKDDMAFDPKWKRWSVEKQNRMQFLDKPIVRSYDGKYITTFLLYADAFNSWMENSIYRGSESIIWKNKICQKIEAYFEEQVIDYMRKHRYIAGKVEQNGMWHIDMNGEAKNLELSLAGEVDVLAVRCDKKTAYLIECKRIHDVVTVPGNIYQKFKNVKRNLIGNYVQKLKKKREVIKQYMEKHHLDYQLVTVILTDINFPVYLPGDKVHDWEKNISICDFDTLKKAVVNNTYPESFVQHI